MYKKAHKNIKTVFIRYKYHKVNEKRGLSHLKTQITSDLSLISDITTHKYIGKIHDGKIVFLTGWILLPVH